MTNSNVSIYRLSWSEDHLNVREQWFQKRQEIFQYRSALGGEQAAEEAFHITNAPEECLTEEQKAILAINQFEGPSLSVGDIVRVQSCQTNLLPEYYLCKSFGWEKFSGNNIELLKHLYW
jgi:hypothetical protein